MQQQSNALPFPWSDSHFLRDAHPDSVAVAARAMCLMEDLQATVQETDMGKDCGDRTWITMGLAWVAKTADTNALAVLLTGLETLIPYERRRHWPLDHLIAKSLSPELERQIREVMDGPES